MKVICVHWDKFYLLHLQEDLPKIIPEAEIQYCDPLDAVQLAESWGCDVLLTEIDMERMPRDVGLILAEKIKALHPRVNIIFITVCGTYEYAERVLGLHASGYLPYSYSLDELTEEFRNLRYPVA